MVGTGKMRTIKVVLCVLGLAALGVPGAGTELPIPEASTVPAFEGMTFEQVPGMRALLTADITSSGLHVRLSESCRCVTKAANCVQGCYDHCGSTGICDKPKCCAVCVERGCLNETALC